MSVGSRIKKLRVDKRISQEKLASSLNVSRQIVSKWENDNSMPDSYNIQLLCDYFGTSSDYLLLGIEDENMKKNRMSIIILISSYIISVSLIIFSIISYATKLNSKDMKVESSSSMVEIPYEIIVLIIGIIILFFTTIILFKNRKKA